MRSVKKYIKNTRMYPLWCYCKGIGALRRKTRENLLRLISKYPMIISRHELSGNIVVRKALAFSKLLSRMSPIIDNGHCFVGHRSIYSFPLYRHGEEYGLVAAGNLTPDYAVILSKGFCGVKSDSGRLLKAAADEQKKSFYRAVSITCDAIIRHSLAYAESLESAARKCDDKERAAALFDKAKLCRKVPNEPALTFKEALQSVYFTNMMLWAEGHSLIGLGRMDQYLWPYYKHDIERGVITNDEAYGLVKQFWQMIAHEMKEKSSILIGDTGQSIVLGGVDALNGRDASNALTSLFMNVAKDARQIDPKIVLRVHMDTPEAVWRDSVELLRAGCGSPLYVNDMIIIRALEEYGYRSEDAHDYGVSACWEPLIPGKAFDINNVSCISFMDILEAALNNGRALSSDMLVGIETGGLKSCENFEIFIEHVKRQIVASVAAKVGQISKMRYEPAPLFSMLTADCMKEGKDISEGGARYNNFGFLSAGFVNMINALVCIKQVVYEQKVLQKDRLLEILMNDYKDNEEWRHYFLNKAPKFGNDIDEVDTLAAELSAFFAEECKRHTNWLGGRYKAGLGGAGAYISEAIQASASADGRKAAEPLANNFSPSLYTEKTGITAVINSAAKVDFHKLFNGSVIDMKLAPSLLKDEESREKFLVLLKAMLTKCEEVQFNVIDTSLLRDAQINPDKHQDLIVRVWGFSAYFVDLPKEYQDQIVHRYEHCA